MTTPTGRHSGYPQPPAHPGRKQDDGARQVSWLPGHRHRSPSRGITSVAHRTIARRLQLRGQPRIETAFPFKSPWGGTLRVLKRAEYIELTLHRASGYHPARLNVTGRGSHDHHHCVRITPHDPAGGSDTGLTEGSSSGLTEGSGSGLTEGSDSGRNPCVALRTRVHFSGGFRTGISRPQRGPRHATQRCLPLSLIFRGTGDSSRRDRRRPHRRARLYARPVSLGHPADPSGRDVRGRCRSSSRSPRV